MNRILLILWIFIISCELWGQVQKTIIIGDFSVTSGLLSGVKTGFGKANINDNSSNEITLNYKVDLEVTFKPQIKGENPLHNIFFQWNRFYNPERTKTFFIIKGGVLWFEMGDWFGGTDRTSTFIFPLVAVGFGYSYKLNDVFYIRPSIDIGVQANLLNIELSFVF